MEARAEDGTRTRDPNLGKVMLYQLSYFRIIFCTRFRSVYNLLPDCECKSRQFFYTAKLFPGKFSWLHKFCSRFDAYYTASAPVSQVLSALLPHFRRFRTQNRTRDRQL